jgi:hypothetical protein
LVDAERLRKEDKEPMVISRSTAESLKSVLGGALRRRGVSDPDSMTLDALAAQFQGPEDRDKAADTLAQMPETGSAGSSGRSPGSIEAAAKSISPKRASEIDEQIRLAEALESRDITKRAGEIRAEIAEDLNVESKKVEALGRRQWSTLTES